MVLSRPSFQKIYSYVPARERRFLKNQAPRATRIAHKLINFLQKELADIKSRLDEEIALGRLDSFKKDLYANALSVTERAVEAVRSIENFDAPVVLEPTTKKKASVSPQKRASAGATAKKGRGQRDSNRLSREEIIEKEGTKRMFGHQSARFRREQARGVRRRNVQGP